MIVTSHMATIACINSPSNPLTRHIVVRKSINKMLHNTNHCNVLITFSRETIHTTHIQKKVKSEQCLAILYVDALWTLTFHFSEKIEYEIGRLHKLSRLPHIMTIFAIFLCLFYILSDFIWCLIFDIRLGMLGCTYQTMWNLKCSELESIYECIMRFTSQ